ncbi:hypothetical protein GSI_02987 [Ganoderma sinense ZZ0214-1]|uniref:Uncharacterized protein n=1 Tax=Ganoderma sinense ZZ0214-1 TaxID=1077348 RepID=A0A2G8SN44_9APHY|nr:hypothetical protein GSI_02987 [Ganoderma sinense ZZ0214-1]
MPEQEDTFPHHQKLTVTIPRRRGKPVRVATLHPSESTASSRPRLRSASTRKKSTAGLSAVREKYGRGGDWKRGAFRELHGLIRCLFCASNPSPNPSLRRRATLNRLPDAAMRHLRDSCVHFEESEMYKKYREESGRTRGGRMSRSEIVAQVVKEDEKIAVALVFCRRDRAHRKRSEELKTSPLGVEEKLGRHAVLCKAEDCECCPHPSFSEWLSGVSKEEDVKTEEEEERPKEGRKKKKRKLKHTVPGQLVHIKQEGEDWDIPAMTGQTSLKSVARKAVKEGNQKRSLKRKAPEDDDALEDEAEVAVLLEQILV